MPGKVTAQQGLSQDLETICPKFLGVLKGDLGGFRCPKGTKMPLLTKTMLPREVSPIVLAAASTAICIVGH